MTVRLRALFRPFHSSPMRWLLVLVLLGVMLALGLSGVLA